MRESRPYGSVRGARDETRVPTATVATSAVGTKRTSNDVRSSVANGGKADIKVALGKI
jgi:hypothetical protein